MLVELHVYHAQGDGAHAHTRARTHMHIHTPGSAWTKHHQKVMSFCLVTD